MKKIQLLTKIATVALALTVSTVGNVALLAQFGGGDGTEANPYQIRTKQHLEELADSVKNSLSNNPATRYNWSRNKYFKVMNNITDTVRTVIGKDNTNAYQYFQGNFDGGGHKIILGIIDMNNRISVGLFGNIYNETNNITPDTISISNVITEGYVKVKGIYSNYFGGIIGLGYGSFIKIINCINNCDVISFSDNLPFAIGGIAGAIAGNCNIENCINNGKISSTTASFNTNIGGIVGQTSIEGKIVNCTNTGEISSMNNIVGGIVGSGVWYDGVTIIENCINSGEITGNDEVGGIVGVLDSNMKVISCLNIGTVKGNDYVGGISSSANLPDIEISNCENYGLVMGNDEVGGILGYISAGTVSNCINGGVVEGKTNVGCIVGEKAGGTVINNHYDMQMCNEE